MVINGVRYLCISTITIICMYNKYWCGFSKHGFVVKFINGMGVVFLNIVHIAWHRPLVCKSVQRVRIAYKACSIVATISYI